VFLQCPRRSDTVGRAVASLTSDSARTATTKLSNRSSARFAARHSDARHLHSA
jgi:hypothetical protein